MVIPTFLGLGLVIAAVVNALAHRKAVKNLNGDIPGWYFLRGLLTLVLALLGFFFLAAGAVGL